MSANKYCKEQKIKECIARRVFCICSRILDNEFFADVPREETHKLGAIADIIKLKKSEYLFLSGSKLEHCYFLLDGQIKLCKEDRDSNKKFILRLIEVSDSIALEYLYQQSKCVHYEAEAMSDSVLLSLDAESFKKIISRNPTLMLNFIEVLSKQVTELESARLALVFDSVKQRLKNYRNQGKTLKISKGDLASLLGTIPETLSRNL